MIRNRPSSIVLLTAISRRRVDQRAAITSATFAQTITRVRATTMNSRRILPAACDANPRKPARGETCRPQPLSSAGSCAS
jgi:hypothetical protein